MSTLRPLRLCSRGVDDFNGVFSLLALCAARALSSSVCRAWAPLLRTGWPPTPMRQVVLAQRLRRCAMRRDLAHVFGRALGHDLAAALAAFGAQVDQPVAGADHVQVVLDHDQASGPPPAACAARASAWRCRRSAGRWWARRTGTACPCAQASGLDLEAVLAASARKPASFRRCASPPDSVGTGWPSFT